MKVWDVPGGDLLVQIGERDIGGLIRFVTPSGARLTVARRFVLVDKSGEIKRDFDLATDSVQEVLSYEAFDVFDKQLRALRCSWADSQLGNDDPTVSERIVLDGLVPRADTTKLGFLKDLERKANASVADRDRRMEQVRAQDRATRLERPDQLPPIAGDGPLDFVLDEVSSNLVLKAAGKELWRESMFGSGRRRPDEIEAVVRARYGARVRSYMSNAEYGD